MCSFQSQWFLFVCVKSAAKITLTWASYSFPQKCPVEYISDPEPHSLFQGINPSTSVSTRCIFLFWTWSVIRWLLFKGLSFGSSLRWISQLLPARSFAPRGTHIFTGLPLQYFIIDQCLWPLPVLVFPFSFPFSYKKAKQGRDIASWRQHTALKWTAIGIICWEMMLFESPWTQQGEHHTPTEQ